MSSVERPLPHSYHALHIHRLEFFLFQSIAYKELGEESCAVLHTLWRRFYTTTIMCIVLTTHHDHSTHHHYHYHHESITIQSGGIELGCRHIAGSIELERHRFV